MIFMVFSVIVISFLGTMGHFMYDLTKHNKIIGLFCAVNESVWEHIKIGLTPTLLWCLLDGLIYGGNLNYFPAKFVSLLVIVVLMPLLFYSYKVFTKKAILPIDIIIFYIVITVSQFSFYYILRIDILPFIYRYISCIGIILVFGSYMVLTLMPLKNELFKDPTSKKYGFKGHTHHHEH